MHRGATTGDIMRGLLETALATAAVLLATVWSTGPAAATVVDRAAGAVRASVDRTRLPIGDNSISRSPTVGSVWSCQTTFTGSGAFRDGPWITGDGTYDYTAKAVVDGHVSWPSRFTIEKTGDTRTITGNGLPSHPTGAFPVARTDDAYQYDRNPNRISEQTVSLSLPATPGLAGQPSCAPGAVGVLLTGSLIFNALDAAGRDAVAHELQDACQGHPQPQGVYHYHNLTSCLDDGGDGHSPLMGYAFDGFGIYGHHGEGGAALTNADLDGCHGHTHAIEWDGRSLEMYHYHATAEFPYTVGCFRGQPATTQRPTGGPGGGTPGGGGPGTGGPGGGGPGGPGGPVPQQGLPFGPQPGQGQGQGFLPLPPGVRPPPPPR